MKMCPDYQLLYTYEPLPYCKWKENEKNKNQALGPLFQSHNSIKTCQCHIQLERRLRRFLSCSSLWGTVHMHPGYPSPGRSPACRLRTPLQSTPCQHHTDLQENTITEYNNFNWQRHAHICERKTR